MNVSLPRRPAKPHVVLCDVDGTLLVLREGVKRIPYGDALALARDQVGNDSVVKLLQALERGGFLVRFTTGRSEELRDVTVAQLEALGFRGVDDRLEMHGYTTMEQLAQDKADLAMDWNAALIIGDQVGIEFAAATRAKCAFLHVDEITGLESLNYTFCWTCGCSSLNPCKPHCTWINPRQCSRCHRPNDHVLEVQLA